LNRVRLPRAVVDRLLGLARESPREEICGLVSRDTRGNYRCYPVPNRAADRKHFFTLDPGLQIDAMRTMREQGEELAAIYHSHPDSPPFPSPADVVQHEYPGVLYLIIAPGAADGPPLRGYYIRGRAIEEVAIDHQEDTPR
jgi:proteasome lid subunit RPN8/RPN11